MARLALSASRAGAALLAAWPAVAADPVPERYVALRARVEVAELLSASEAAWAGAAASAGDPTPSPPRSQHSGRREASPSASTSPIRRRGTRSRRATSTLWKEEVVELFLDVGSTRRSYAELEWNPAGNVVDLWVDRPEEPLRQDLGRGGTREPRPRPEGRGGPRDGLDRGRLHSLDGACGQAPAGTRPAACTRRPLALQRLPHRAAGRPAGSRDGRAVLRLVADGAAQLPRARGVPRDRVRRRAGGAVRVPGAVTRRRAWHGQRRDGAGLRPGPAALEEPPPKPSTRWTASTG